MTDEADEFALVHREIDVFHRGRTGTEPLGNTGNLQQDFTGLPDRGAIVRGIGFRRRL